LFFSYFFFSWDSAALNRGNAPEAFTALPEWVIEDLTDFCVFVCRNLPDKLHLAMFDDIFSLAALLLDQPLYIKNPYNRSKFIEVGAIERFFFLFVCLSCF